MLFTAARRRGVAAHGRHAQTAPQDFTAVSSLRPSVPVVGRVARPVGHALWMDRFRVAPARPARLASR